MSLMVVCCSSSLLQGSRISARGVGVGVGVWDGVGDPMCYLGQL